MITSPFGFAKDPSQVDLEELRQWILYEDENLLVLNKPGWLVCHPSKDGPLSSLVGAAKCYLKLEKLHLISRLDRETSGLVVFGKNPRTARAFQKAIEARKVDKEYVALLRGALPLEPLRVDQPLAKDHQSPVHAKQVVREDRTAQQAVTWFYPLQTSGNWTLCRVTLETGRKHQIRAHAEYLDAPVAGDKLYSGDPRHFLQFIESGWTEELAAVLQFPRQMLHSHRVIFHLPNVSWIFEAPPPEDFQQALEWALGERAAELPQRKFNTIS